MTDNLVIHLTDPYYHPACDKTFGGYTAHYCEALAPSHPVEGLVPERQWIKKGDHRNG